VLEAPFFLFVGSLEPRKNLSLLLEAWNQMKFSDFELVVAGTSSHVFRNTGFAVAENVRFLGRVDDSDLPILYSAAHAFVFPSTYEGFGLPPLEAMACGCPVLSSDATSLPEVCGPAFDPAVTTEGAVFYFQPGNVESLLQCLRKMTSCTKVDRKRMSENAIRRARLFSWEESAAKTFDLLDQIAIESD
jgi:glycosyltransferase involved in cell wall biosynthesis